MDSLWRISLVLALFLLPLVAYHVVLRRGGTRGQVLAATVGAGGCGGLFVLVLAVLGAPGDVSPSVAALSVLPWILPALAWGLVVGVAGLLARAAGGWLGRRP